MDATDEVIHHFKQCVLLSERDEELEGVNIVHMLYQLWMRGTISFYRGCRHKYS